MKQWGYITYIVGRTLFNTESDISKLLEVHKVVRTGPYRLFHLRLSKVLPPTFCAHANTLQIWYYKLLCFVLTRNAKQQIAIIAFYLLLEDCLHANEKLLAR